MHFICKLNIWEKLITKTFLINNQQRIIKLKCSLLSTVHVEWESLSFESVIFGTSGQELSLGNNSRDEEELYLDWLLPFHTQYSIEEFVLYDKEWINVQRSIVMAKYNK